MDSIIISVLAAALAYKLLAPIAEFLGDLARLGIKKIVGLR